MRIANPIASIAVLLLLSACGTTPVVPEQGYEQWIVGKWHCETEYFDKETGVKLFVETEDEYLANGEFTSQGFVILGLPLDNVPVEYSASSEGTWKQIEQDLIFDLKNIKVKNISHPHAEKDIGFESMTPKQSKDIYEIIEIDSNIFVYKDIALDVLVSCTK